MSNDIDKHLADAMGDGGDDGKKEEPKASTSKATLRTPAIVAKPAEESVAPPPQLAYELLKLEAKNAALMELLAEERALRLAGSAIDKKLGRHAAVVEDAEPEETVRFKVNLPAQADKIRIDGREYYHGFTYDIPMRQALSMRDIQAQSWRHDDQVRGFTPHSRGSSTSGIHIDGNGNAITNPAAGFQ